MVHADVGDADTIPTDFAIRSYRGIPRRDPWGNLEDYNVG